MPEVFAPLSDEEKGRIRHHLGYSQPSAVANIQLGIPALTQTSFLLEANMNRIPDTVVGIIRAGLSRLDQLEVKLFDTAFGLDAEKVDEIVINLDQPNHVEREYVRWVDRLADDLACVKNPYSVRWMGTGRSPLSVPVIH